MTPASRRPKAKPRPPRASSSPAIGSIDVPGLKKPHPEVGLGLWNRGRWERDTEAHIATTIDRALERGVTWLDTAEVYGAGRSERLLGAALGDHEPLVSRLFIVTKVSWEHLRSAQIRAAIQGSLERLGRPKVDLYLVHAPDSRVPIAETMATLGEVMDQGRIDAVGVSNFSVEELEAAQSALGPRKVAVNQVRYNLIEREDGDPLREVPVVGTRFSWRPTPRSAMDCSPAAISRPARCLLRPVRAVRAFSAENLGATLEQARALQELADSAHVPLPSIAFHWLRLQGAAPLFGASQPSQVEDNLAAWATRPPKSVLESADAITAGAHA